MVTLPIEEEGEAEEKVEEEENCWMRDLLRKTQLECLEEAQLMDLEGEIVEDSIPKASEKEMKDIGK